ncbi:MAG: NAD(P)H-hydrate dehydratase [Erythrobacter sp.]
MSSPTSEAQVLTGAQMRAAEAALFDAGTSESVLMERAGAGAADWVRRIAAGRAVSVLAGPGNNGGDGYVIARHLREAGNTVRLIAPLPPASKSATAARDAWDGPTMTSGDASEADVLVDCMFGTGLSRPLSPEHALLLRDLAERHKLRIAIDLPSGIATDSGAALNEKLPHYDVTLALGAWKLAHWSLPGRDIMGAKRLIPLGIGAVEGAARLIGTPQLRTPISDAHKYTRGLAAIIGGEMPGAAVLAAEAAQRAGAGYVKLVSDQSHPAAGADLVIEKGPPAEALDDERIAAVLVGPGLGRGGAAKDALGAAMKAGRPLVLDADALTLLAPNVLNRDIPILATPHDGELETLCRSFRVVASGRRDRAAALARATGMVVLAKGPDSVVAAPDGRVALARPASSWLSTAGTGDVLAGIAVSRLAVGRDPFTAAGEALWLHGEAARRLGPAFTAGALAYNVDRAFSRAL